MDTVVAPDGIATGAGATVAVDVVGATGDDATGTVCAAVAEAVVATELLVGATGASKVATAGGTSKRREHTKLRSFS